MGMFDGLINNAAQTMADALPISQIPALGNIRHVRAALPGQTYSPFSPTTSPFLASMPGPFMNYISPFSMGSLIGQGLNTTRYLPTMADLPFSPLPTRESVIGQLGSYFSGHPSQPSQPSQPAAAPPSAPPSAPATQPTMNASSPQAFVQSLLPYAQQVATETGIPLQVLLAIPANETGWGRAGTSLYGMKGSGSAGSYNSPTWEVVNGQRVNTNANFAAYNSPLDAMRDFARLIQSTPRYAAAMPALAAGGIIPFMRAIQAGGYATDPNWANQVATIALNDIPTLLGGR